MRRYPKTNRDGALLIVVLALLALFALVGITFLMTAEQEQAAAVAASKEEQFTDPYDALLERAMSQILVGSTDRFSAIGPHSLLEDMYGLGLTNDNNGNPLRIPSGGFAAGNSNFASGNAGAGGMMYISNLPLNNPWLPIKGYYNGRILTMLTGPAKGKSSRITGYAVDLNAGTAALRLMPFAGMKLDGGGAWSPEGAPQAGDAFVVNDLPFNGTGFGYDPRTFGTAAPGTPTLLDAKDSVTGGLIAYLPNPRIPSYNSSFLYNSNIPVAADEDYDVADFQNMLLAYTVASQAGIKVPIPSLHRPALIRYWGNTNNNADPDISDPNNFVRNMQLDLKRRVFLRPLVEDHPKFGEVNPAFAPYNADGSPNTGYAPLGLNGQYYWDVDNDGDGQTDSVWVDLGMPVMSDPQGRLFKPLFALLVRDMDGKLNLNVHGRLNEWLNDPGAQSLAGASNPVATPDGDNGKVSPHKNIFLRPGGGPGSPAGMPAGVQATGVFPVGYALSPASIALSWLDFNLDGTEDPANEDVLLSSGEFLNILRGRVMPDGRVVEGRYGEGWLLNNNAIPLAGMTVDPNSGTFIDDNYPGAVAALNFSTPTILGNGGTAQLYGTPIDLDENGSFFVNAAGQPVYYFMGAGNGPGGSVAEPQYEAEEIDVFTKRSYPTPSNKVSTLDNPFTPEDLEWLLRQYDVDATTLKSRLRDLAPSFSSTPYARNIATTHSFDVPAPSYVPTPEIARALNTAGQSKPNCSIFELIYGRIVASDNFRSGGVLQPVTTTPQERLNTLLGMGALPSQNQDNVAPELLMGLRMDINRPFGNNFDDDGDGVVDDIKEIGNEQLYNGASPVTDRNGDGFINGFDSIARQRFAKHLFILLMTLKDSGYLLESPQQGVSPQERYEMTVRQLAQWCINVADFRDSDDIMTPFEYDVDPFNDNGWSVDGDLTTDDGTDRRVVWGLEFPSVVLTETLAWHDLRCKDEEAGNHKKTTDMNDPDPDVDQFRVPEGGAFVELFCPRYLSMGGVDLGRVVGNYPVWRLGVTTPDQDQFQQRINDKRDTVSLEPKPYPDALVTDPLIQPDGWKGFSNTNRAANTPVTLERYLVFTEANITLWPGVDPERVFYVRRQQTFLDPGQYAVVGSAGRKNGQRKTLLGPPAGSLEFDLSGAFAQLYKGGQVAPYGANPVEIRDVIPCPATQGRDNTYTYSDANLNVDFQFGFNISEPLYDGNDINTWYPITGVSMVTTTYTDQGDGTGEMIDDQLNTVADKPYDMGNTRPVGKLAGDPTTQIFLGTELDYKTVVLQRLANPVLPWNSVTNPYITVDWMPIDLTVFNTSETVDPPNNWAKGLDDRDTYFASRERGGAGNNRNIWRTDWELPEATAKYGRVLQNDDHTFGYLNEPFHSANAPKWLYANNPYNDPTLVGYPNVGQQQKAFPWLVWNNRPFTSGLELLQVPASSPQRLGLEFATMDEQMIPFYKERGDQSPSAPFGHLLNFFFSSKVDSNFTQLHATRDSQTSGVSNYHRLFDYVHVPSRFSGTETMLDPRVYTTGNGQDKAQGEFAPYYAPFNRLSTYREPGRVNINTIPDTDNRVWMGILNGLDTDASWGKVLTSRQGHSNANPRNPTLNSNLPTFFSNPFRSFGSSYYVPSDELARNQNVAMAPYRELIDSSFLRRDLASSAGDNPPVHQDEPLFSFVSEPSVYDSTSGNAPVWKKGEFNDSERNSYYRHQTLQRLSNLLTTRSNVYAAWITVGYFEVRKRSPNDGLPGPPDGNFAEAYPDGYELMGELGADTGEVKRHRAFMIIDRSIPAGFVRGKRLNSFDTVLLKRIIE